MAGVLMCAARFLFLFLLNSIVVSCGPGNRPVQSVPEPLIQSALNSLNEDSPTHHTYKGGNLISVQKLDESPYVIYRLTFDLTPVCKESLEPCPREACTVEVKQHEQGDINVLRESIQCMYLYPQLPQDEPSHAQENQEHEIIENLEKQIITNQSVELDHEIQKTGDHNEKPFIAMRASSPNYCPGCPYELNPNLPGLVAFGEQAAKSMDEFVQNDYKHKVVDIIKVTRAVPPSSNVIQYRILLRIGESNCLKNAIEQNTECSVQESLPIKTCQITFEEQPWQQLSRRITKNNCTASNSIESKINSYSTLGVESLVTLAPKKQEVDPAKAEALENLKNILDNYTNAVTTKVEEQQQLEVTEHPMVKVSLNRSDDDTKPQRFEDKLKEFREFVKDFDLPVRKAKSSPETNREEVVEETIIPKKVSADPTANENLERNRRMLGGPKKTDVNDPEIQEAASKGLKKLSEGYQGTNEPIITEIVEASKQIVSGTLYKIKAKVGPSTCLKGVKDNCQLQEGSEIQECLFSIWSQPWMDNGSPEIKINCNLHSQQKRSLHGDELFVSNERMKRESPVVGAPSTADINDPEIQEAASKGLKKLSEGYQGTNEPIITEIVEASKQIVSGTLYKIKAKVGPSTCLKGVKDNCQLQEGSEIQECLFSIWSQPWMDNGSPEIKINCNLHSQQKRSLHGDELFVSNERMKRESPVVGAPSTADINDPEIQEAASKGLKKLSEGYQGTNEPIITEIVEASKQIVSGTLYKIKAKVGSSTCLKGVEDNCQLQEGSEIQECLFSIWSQPWVDNGSPEIKINCNLHSQQKRSLHGDELFVSNERFKRKSGIPGAPHNADVNDPEIQEAANKGLKKLSEGYQGTNEPIITEIVEASKQTVSGTLYKIKAKVGPSTCPKGVKDNCQLQEGSEIQECLFSVWSQPWVDKGSAEITVNCNLQHQKKRSIYRDELFTSDERFKREVPIPGGQQAADINDPEIQDAADKGLKKLSEDYQGTNEPIITEIVEASKQTVSGTLYKIKAKVGPSTCPKGVKDNCQLQEGSEIQECLFSVWSQPWVDKGSAEITVNCNLQHQKKRSIYRDELFTSDERFKREVPIPGGQQAADINDPEIQDAADKGLKKLSEDYQGTNEPIITEIVEASKQTVSGTLYKIKAKVGPSTCPKGVKDNCQLQEGSEIQECLFSIWSQPWVDNGSPEITINCNAHNQQENQRTKRKSDVTGALITKRVNDPEIKIMANKGLEKFSENSEGTHEPMIVEIVEASKQVVSGFLYKIKVKLGTSTCHRGVKNNCTLKEGSDIKECLFTIWSQPWIENESPEITINCDLTNRRKRSLRGVDYNNKMLKIAEEAATDIKEQYMFEKFVREYEKTYSSAEEKQSRYEIFKRNLKVIQEVRDAEQGTAKYGVTMFADLTPKEFKSMYLGYRPNLKQENAIPFPEAEIPDIKLPSKFDWRDKNVVTAVKDQGQCGSCWAFSVTGNVESQYAIKHGKLLSLSEQELVDCDNLDLGCGGGEMDNAYTTIEKLGGLELETDYPYDARNEKCHFNKDKAVVNVVSALNISSNETKMAQWLVKNGPISIAINANAMQFYMGGVSHPLKFLCSPENLDHGVLIVGYGTSVYPIFKKVKPYWIIKNSWGPRWGEQGYYRVYRGDGTCGLNKTPSSAVVA